MVRFFYVLGACAWLAAGAVSVRTATQCRCPSGLVHGEIPSARVSAPDFRDDCIRRLRSYSTWLSDH